MTNRYKLQQMYHHHHKTYSSIFIRLTLRYCCSNHAMHAVHKMIGDAKPPQNLNYFSPAALFDFLQLNFPVVISTTICVSDCFDPFLRTLS